MLLLRKLSRSKMNESCLKLMTQTMTGKSGVRQGAAHKWLKSPKWFTNLPLGVNVINFELNGLPRSYNTLIEVFKFI